MNIDDDDPCDESALSLDADDTVIGIELPWDESEVGFVLGADDTCDGTISLSDDDIDGTAFGGFVEEIDPDHPGGPPFDGPDNDGGALVEIHDPDRPKGPRGGGPIQSGLAAELPLPECG